ncbi:MAG: S-layer homology domain-containing protein [Firmicutes bacterium]|nr:S-layer homology domain-containing protein [Bacillota bacterium]
MINIFKKISATLTMFFLVLPLLLAYAAPADLEGRLSDEAIEVLDSLGIMAIYEDGNFYPNEQISRAEFTSLIVRLMNKEEIVGGFLEEGESFSDVAIEHWASGYIKAALKLGVISDAREFRPDAVITYQEAVCMLLRSLGYATMAQQRGGYPAGYMAAAVELNIFSQAADYEKLTRLDAAQLLFKSFNVKLMFQDFGGKNSYISDETALSYYLGLEEKIGVVEGQGKRGLTAINTLKETEVCIDGAVYKRGSFDFSKLIGHRIKLYVKNDEDEEKTIHAVYNNKKTNTVFSPEIDNIHEFSIGRLAYYAGGQIYRASIERFAPIIYNGRVWQGAVYDNLLPSDGSVTLLDNNGDGVFDIIFIEDVKTFISEKTIPEENRIILKNYDYQIQDENYYEGLPYIDLGSLPLTAEVSITTSLGEQIDLGAIQQGYCFSIAKSKDEKLITIVLLLDNIITGIVEEIDAEGNSIVINGKGYKLLKGSSAALPENIVVGDSGEFYTTGNGKIFAKLNISEKISEYAYVVDFFVKKFSTVFKLYTETGEFLKPELAGNVLFNGAKSGISDIINEFTALDEDGVSRVKHQLIKYSLNAKGQLKEIIIPEMDVGRTFDTTKFLQNVKQTVLQLGSGQKLGFEYIVGDNTDIITIPVKAIEIDLPGGGKKEVLEIQPSMETNFGISKGLNVRDDLVVSIFNAARDRVAGILVVYKVLGKGAAINYGNAIAVVDSISKAADSEGNIVSKLYYYSGGVLRSIMPSVRDGEENHHVETAAAIRNHESPPVEWENLRRGDVIQFVTNSYNEVIAFTQLVNYAQRNGYATISSGGGTANDRMRLIQFCRIEDKAGASIIIDMPELRTYVVSGGNIYIYDSETDRIEAVSPDSLTEDIKGCDMVIQSRYNSVSNVVIYK